MSPGKILMYLILIFPDTCASISAPLSSCTLKEAFGRVMETLPNASFKVQLESGAEILAHVSGKMRMRYIRILPGDTVEMEVSPYDPTRGRIIWRHK